MAEGGRGLVSVPGFMGSRRLELPEALIPCQWSCHSRNRTLCHPPFQPDFTHWTDHEPLIIPWVGFLIVPLALAASSSLSSSIL